MQTITRADVDALAASNTYYSERWPYLSVAARMAQELPPGPVLEIGAYCLPIVPGSETLDSSASVKPTYLHDARFTPWPVGNKRFTLVIALQVFEHLQDAQRAAFAEATRLARFVLISLPYKWKCADPTDCHHQIDDAKIATWTRHAVPLQRVIVNDPCPRVVLLFRGEIAAASNPERRQP